MKSSRRKPRVASKQQPAPLAAALRSDAEGAAAGPPRVGRKLKTLRQKQGLSLEALSRRAGVSKSMLSQVERNKTNPTVAVVWRLAAALRVSLTDILSAHDAQGAMIRLLSGYATPTLSSPDGKCELRILGPVELAGHHEWYELVVRPSGLLDSEAHAAQAREQLTVLEGMLEVRAGAQTQSLRAGDTARYPADVPHSIRNPGPRLARALLVVHLH